MYSIDIAKGKRKDHFQERKKKKLITDIEERRQKRERGIELRKELHKSPPSNEPAPRDSK